MRRTISVLIVVTWCGLSSTVQAQFGIGDLVYDPTNWIENSVTSVKTAATAANTAEIIANQVLELTGLDAWALESFGNWEEDLQHLQELASQGEGLSWDLESLGAQITQLFDLDGAPLTSHDFRERQQEIRRYLYQSWSYALKTQTLVTSVLLTVQHILGIYSSVQELIGNKQGQQSLAQYQAKLTQVLSEMHTVTTAAARAKSVQGINDPLIAQSIDHINHGVLDDWAEGDTGQ
jgi:type IV secretion system protein TrbJ